MGISSRDLRIGNYISVENEKHRPDLTGLIIEVNSITNLNGHDFSIGLNLPSHENGYYQTTSQFIKFIKPIPLTEKWILKFGFEKKQKGDFYFDRNMDLIIFGDTYDYNGLFIGKIESVHQLQNLYFALTNEELTIK